MTDTPLLIGTTGHRDLTADSVEKAMVEVRDFFSKIQKLLPNTPLQLMSGLADGADRVVAKTALEMGIDVQAVLPMPRSMYEKDFSPESLDDFNELIDNNNVELIELPLPSSMNPSSAAEYGVERDQLYAQLGEYLILRSGILLALWDGFNSDLTGGTSDVILRYLNAGGAGINTDKEMVYLNEIPAQADGPEFVYWIPVERTDSNGSLPADTARNGCYLSGNLGPNTLYRQMEMPEELALQLKHLDAYNKQYKDIVADGSFFTWGGMLESLPNAVSHPEYQLLKGIDDEYQKADGLALYNQKRSDRQFKLFAYMAALMGLFFLFYAKILAAKFFLIGYLVLFMAGLWLFRQTDKKDWFTRHLMQRVIAETLRTRFYLILASVDKRVNVNKMLDLTGVSHFSGFSWINQVYRSHQSLDNGNRQEDQHQRDIDFVHEKWLDDQTGYFSAKIQKLSDHHHKLEKIKNKLLIGSAAAVVVLIFFKKYLVDTTIIGTLDLKTLLVFLMGLLPFWLGVWEIYQSKMAVKELLWQYRNQSNLYNLASAQISHSSTMEQQQNVLAELGQKSLMENYLWTIHRYHREHEPPTAG